MNHISNLLNNYKTVNILTDARNYNLQEDKRFLIPYTTICVQDDIKYGFVDKNGNVIIDAIYDIIYDDFYSADDIVRVGKRYVKDDGTKEKPNQYTYFHCGLINAKGEELIPFEKYDRIIFTHDNKLLIVRKDFTDALIDIHENTIVPFGKYDVIRQFIQGFSRVRHKETKKHAIIDTEGREIITENQFDTIWTPKEEYDSIIVVKNSIRYAVPYIWLEQLKKEIDETGNITTSLESLLTYEEPLQRDFSQNAITIDLS